VGKRLKILIAYDGSESVNKGIDDLSRAGLPVEVDALVVSVAEVWLPPPPGDFDDTFPLQIPAGLQRARERAAQIVKEAQELVSNGSERVRKIFPQWTVRDRVSVGSPAHEVLNLAREWEPNLIVVGSHGRSALGRFVLGSVSQKILTEAQTSVRVARQSTGTGASAARILLGIDGSAGAEEALRAVAARNWMPGSEVRVVVADDLLMANSVYRVIPPINQFVNEVNENERTEAERIAEETVNQLRLELEGKNVTVSSVVLTGNPKQQLVRHAEEFGADCIFTGATGFSNPIERLLVGSVSAAVAARAHCSVEVVRAR
jgi:nucleotide-binding universal stress UspA family protein